MAVAIPDDSLTQEALAI